MPPYLGMVPLYYLYIHIDLYIKVRDDQRTFKRLCSSGFWISVFLTAWFLPPAPPATLPAALSHRPALFSGQI